MTNQVYMHNHLIITAARRRVARVRLQQLCDDVATAGRTIAMVWILCQS